MKKSLFLMLISLVISTTYGMNYNKPKQMSLKEAAEVFELEQGKEYSKKDLQNRYPQLSQKWHPDVAQHVTKKEATAKFEQIGEAWNVLQNQKYPLVVGKKAKLVTSLVGVQRYTLQKTLRGHHIPHCENRVTALTTLKDGSIVSSGSFDHTIKIWDPASGKLKKTLHNHRWVTSLAELDSGLIAAGLDNGDINIWNPASGEVEHLMCGHFLSPYHGDAVLTILDDGRLVVGLLDDKIIEIWDPTKSWTGSQVESGLELDLQNNSGINSLTTLKNGLIAAGLRNGDINIWNPGSGELEKTLHGHTHQVDALATLDDGKLVSGSDDEITIKIWDPVSGKLLQTLQNNERVKILTKLENGKIAAGGGDFIKIWDSHSGKLEQTLQNNLELIDRENDIFSLTKLEHGKIAAGLRDGHINIWAPDSKGKL